MSHLVTHGVFLGHEIMTALGEFPDGSMVESVATIHYGATPDDTRVETWGCRWYAKCGNDAVVIIRAAFGDFPACARCAQKAGIDMGQPTPAEDRANGTVSAANVPAADAAHNPDVANGEVFVPTSDVEAANIEHVAYIEDPDESDEDPNAYAESSTPLFDGTPNAAAVTRDPALGWEVDKRA